MSAVEGQEQIVIRNEEEAFAYLEAALHDAYSDSSVAVSFEGWPTVTIKLDGAGYDRTITPDIAEALVTLQQSLNRAYARAVHDSTNARVLTNAEKQNIQFKAKVSKGSSLIEINLSDQLQKIALELVTKMPPELVVVTILGLAVVAGSTFVMRDYIRRRSEDKQLGEQTRERIAMSEQETRRTEILAGALTRQPYIEHVQRDFDDARRDVLKGVGDAEKLEVQGIPLTPKDAKVVAATPRAETQHVQLNATYRIEKIDWSGGDETRVWLINVDSGRKFAATMNIANMAEDQKNLFRDAEWSQAPVYLSVNATELRGEVTTAAIVNVAWPAAAAGS